MDSKARDPGDVAAKLERLAEFVETFSRWGDHAVARPRSAPALNPILYYSNPRARLLAQVLKAAQVLHSAHGYALQLAFGVLQASKQRT